MMKKQRFVLPMLLFCLLCLAGCGSPPEDAGTPLDYAAARISYLGPEGTYTQEACQVFFENQGVCLPYATVDEAVQALATGESDYAVIPQENTTGGAVVDYLDSLIAQQAVSVVGEVELPIRQNLLGLPGASLAEIERVYSHKQGLAQGRDWLEKNLPQAALEEVSSTAEGAKMVAEGGDPSRAAVASAGCAAVYGLDLLAESIQGNDNNKTRFYVLSLDAPRTEPAERLAFVAVGAAEDLPGLMTEMENQDMTLVAIHDRPKKTELGEYYYLIECADSSYASYQKLTASKAFTFRYLGSFDAR